MRDDDVDIDVTSVDAADGDGGGNDVAKKAVPSDDNLSTEKSQPNIPVSVAELIDDTATPVDQSGRPVERGADNNVSGDAEEWSMDEKEKLFQFIAKVFTPSFPPYFAYKHCIHTSLEDLSKQDACALNNYCELSVCNAIIFFCVFVIGKWFCN